MRTPCDQTEFVKSHTKKQGSFSEAGHAFTHWVNPANWSLNTRFLYLTGAMLTFGCITLIWVFYYYQSSILSESVNSRLLVFDGWIQDKLNSEQDVLYNEVAPVASMKEVVESMRTQDRESLKGFILPYMEKLRAFSFSGSDAFYYHFHLPPAQSFLRTWDLEHAGADLTDLRPMVVKANKYKAPFKGVEVGPGGAVMRAIMPITGPGGGHLGTVEVASSIEGFLQRVQTPPYFGMVFLLNERYAGVINQNLLRPVVGRWLMGKSLGISDEQALVESLRTGVVPRRVGDTYFRFVPVEDFQGAHIGGILLAFDSSSLVKGSVNESLIFGLAFGCGAMALWFILYMNVRRVKRFLSRFNRILAATSAGIFSERFESETIHCLEILRCNNKRCPVYENPSLVCYLEAGSEAISPVLRNTCVYLSTYRKCKYCPVYAIRHGDELVEMRNVVNTMMHMWGSFVVQVNQVISGVFQSRELSQAVPSLDHISDTLDHISGLTRFNYDLQGAASPQEVFAMLDKVFTQDFGLTQYAIFDLDAQGANLSVAASRFADQTMLCCEVFRSPESCRAIRMAEEVSSSRNSGLCPYFHIDAKTQVRCCQPMVVGGKVGRVFSFVYPQEKGEETKMSMSVIHKYLLASAPVLSTLALLEQSKQNALYDPLTGARNRRFLDEYVKTYEAVALRDGRQVGFIMADVDYFKQVNDKYGHLAGDAVLKTVASLITGVVRRADLVVRFGGEEFLIMLHEVQPGYTAQVAEKIRRCVEDHAFQLPDGGVVHKTISLGVSEFPGDATLFYKAIKYCDVALYKAKSGGRNKVVHFEEAMWSQEKY